MGEPPFFWAFFFVQLTLVPFRLAAGACRQHRGPRTGGKKSLAKQSYQHCNKLFNATIPGPKSDAVLHALPTEVLRDQRTEEEIDAVLPWVRRFHLLTLLLFF